MKRPARIFLLSWCRSVLLAGLFLTCFPRWLHGQPAPGPASPAPPAEEDIRGPRGAIPIPESDTTPVALWLGAAAALGLVGLLLWIWKRRSGPLLSLSPLEQAREELRCIDAERSTLTAGALADRTAGAVRQFIAGNFGIAAPQRTTEEFLHYLSHNNSSPLLAQAGLLQEFLRSCDMAKFARADLDGVERFALLETARRFIQAAAYTAPAGPPPENASSVPPQSS